MISLEEETFGRRFRRGLETRAELDVSKKKRCIAINASRSLRRILESFKDDSIELSCVT